MLVVLAIGIGLVLLVGAFCVAPSFIARARRRGYRSLGVRVALCAGIGVSVGVIYVSVDRISGELSFIAYGLVLPVAAWAATTFVIVSILPRKNSRFLVRGAAGVR
jgi:hypothetical protein